MPTVTGTNILIPTTVSIHLREGENRTNWRSEAIAKGLENYGIKVKYCSRAVEPRDDLCIQTGFSHSAALSGAISRGIPFIIMEEPVFRGFQPNTISWGYNGLAGGAFRPEPLDDLRPAPRLRKAGDGPDLIIGQKPTDHSLRGEDHIAWLKSMQEEYPEAELRHHPLMVPTEDTIEDALARSGDVHLWNSTVCVDALVAGNVTHVYGPGAEWDGIEDREKALHRLSYAQFQEAELWKPETIEYILSGYEEACNRAPEIPREKVDGRAICEQYYRTLGKAQHGD